MTWHEFVSHIFAYLAQHVGTDEFVLWSILSAAALNMPVPGSPATWRTLYEWLYNTVHQFLNTGRTPRPTQAPPESQKS
jgi:hypothetical protein